MIRHAITRGELPLRQADILHLRAKELEAGDLLSLARLLREQWPGILLINDRIDVCLASGADGVHLPSHRIAPSRIKDSLGQKLIVGVSCHSVEEAAQAEAEGADYVYLSPIFEKPGYAPPLGLEALAEASRRLRIPVIALGGITSANEDSCIAAGAKGIAGISYFQFPI
jgi:thiamine-phosphate pyrophosphorylase